MKRQFRVTASRISRISGASADENPKAKAVEDVQDRIEDDFDYVLAGVERLGREGQLDTAIDIMEKIASALDNAIGVIGEDFSSDTE